jgi:preprotein translocase subunit SecD
MNKKLKYRVLLITLVLVISCVMLFLKDINLGLDLRGGVHLVLQVETEEALEEELNQTRERIETALRDLEIVFSDVTVQENVVSINKVTVSGEDAVDDYLSQFTPAWNYRSRTRDDLVTFSMEMTPAYRKTLATQSVSQARNIVEKRVDQYGVAEPTITVYGSGAIQDQIIVELPGVDDFERIKDLIKSTARLELKMVHPAQGGPYSTQALARSAFAGAFPEDYEILPYRDRSIEAGKTMYMVVKKAASISGKHLKNARRSQDPFSGQSEVLFYMNSEGVNLFAEATGANVGNRLAIVLDDFIRTAPNIESRIDSESARITGHFSVEEADDLALTLRSGALPAKLRILEERSVGPSLGRDSIMRGVYASLLGLILVMMGMLVVYRLSGANALICLTLNLLILLAVLAYFGATLTLPGIAGIILTIGIAVDANILIFERIKEELRLGKTPRSSIESGFKRVFGTIIDTNVTTLVASLFLFQFGTGPVKGFAVTLAVGLVANIFTATFVSRTFFSLILNNREVKKLSI